MARGPGAGEEGGQACATEEMSVIYELPASICLFLTVFIDLGIIIGAHTEYQIVSQATKRPTTSSSANKSPNLVSLSAALENEKTDPEDAFQAQTCLGWAHWIDGEPELAVSSLPSNLPKTIDPATEKQGTLRGWTHVCIIKSAYIRG